MEVFQVCAMLRRESSSENAPLNSFPLSVETSLGRPVDRLPPDAARADARENPLEGCGDLVGRVALQWLAVGKARKHVHTQKRRPEAFVLFRGLRFEVHQIDLPALVELRARHLPSGPWGRREDLRSGLPTHEVLRLFQRYLQASASRGVSKLRGARAAGGVVYGLQVHSFVLYIEFLRGPPAIPSDGRLTRGLPTGFGV